MERKSGRPDAPAVCHATVRAAVGAAALRVPGLKLIAGGKSFGGRMTSQAQALQLLPEVEGLAFLGFPLHPAGQPTDARAAHLADVRIPMLFLQGEQPCETSYADRAGVAMPRCCPRCSMPSPTGRRGLAIWIAQGSRGSPVEASLADSLSYSALSRCRVDYIVRGMC